jgi:hypothetical protein
VQVIAGDLQVMKTYHHPHNNYPTLLPFLLSAGDAGDITAKWRVVVVVPV